MDFWQRLIAGTSLAPASSKATLNNPDKRLAKFKREYNRLLQLWRSAAHLARDYETAEQIRICLSEITRVLSDESRRPLPHPCIAFAAEKQIYISIGKIATTSYNEGIIREAVSLFAALLDSEEENFVENDVFAKSLMNLLVRITGANSISLGSELVVEVVELSFNITTKIRLDPEILPVWFTSQRKDEDVAKAYAADPHEKFAGKTHKEDFQLFYLLIDYIHEEGRCGDFARTGLLYIIEAASNDVALEQWIVESDLATLMATGLGALYSQLSRKLVIDHPPDALPPVLALSDYRHPLTTHEIVSSVDEDYQSHMETFLSHLVFWQDVLNHCKSVEVKQTLLEHFQVIFLQQLLYPSLLESSDVDGGSSVAVLTYLRRILESLDHPDMIHLILHYLLALPETAPVPSGSKASVSAARKRKSLDLATLVALQVEGGAPALYNLVDLILGSLRSESSQTVTVTLQLVSVILKRHHRYAVTTLLRTGQALSDGPQRSIAAHEREIESLLTMAEDLGGDDDFDEVYENHIKDSMNILESHSCSLALVAPKSASGTSKFPSSQATIPGAPRDIRHHTLRPEDPVLVTLLDILSTFFINSVETNLSLTAAIVDLATCGFMSVDGWLLPDPSKYVYEESEEGRAEEIMDDLLLANIGDPDEIQERSQIRALKLTQRRLKWSATPKPELFTRLDMLVDQVNSYRAEIPRFDDILQQRRDAFQQAASMSTPVRHRQRSYRESSTHAESPPRQSALEKVAQRIFSDSNAPSRSGSPQTRGRPSNSNREQGSASGSHGTNRTLNPPLQFTLGPETPSRGSSHSRSSMLPDDDLSVNKTRVPPSQTAAFAAVDQGLLNRMVGIPTSKKDVVPIPFPDLKKVKAEERDTEASETTDGAVESKTLAENYEMGENESVGGKGKDGAGGDQDTGKYEEGKDVDGEGKEDKKVSVSHILTNVIVLQEFLLELAALVQVRAGLFGEVKFV
ncbi:hypothetical protein MFRU_036g00490 [Monilinia fructicola]|uniref:Retinoic acid induced 16-like protein-domain-containing protein n=1 Tax=Monilinia fructicola TaxID=38448 RepID=A0A5M9J3Z1_MONFR|nr:hypothetical protein EYC84_011869 [Monilinia fructicola]KAG4026816.1 hypothetical protein MFRU_036g00490 [Monilinia fructicola]